MISNILYTIYWAKTQKMSVQKMSSFFIRELYLIIVLFLISNLHMSWSVRFASLKLCKVFSILDSVFHFRIKVNAFVKQNARTFWLYNVIISFKIEMIEKPHTVLPVDMWFLSCNKKFENLMIFIWVGASQKPSWWQIFQT